MKVKSLEKKGKIKGIKKTILTSMIGEIYDMIIGEILYGLLNSYEEYTVKKREERDSS